MSTLYFLNVKQGDCIGIEHPSGHKTVIDVCNASPPDAAAEAQIAALAAREALKLAPGNFNQKKYPVNPVSYFQNRGWSSVFRFIVTHPDMDHLDGIEAFFDAFKPTNLWDTDNEKEIPASAWRGPPYSEGDWRFYKDLRDSDPDDDPNRLTLYSGSRGQYYNVGYEGKGGGDGLQIMAPTKELVATANEVDEDYNRCSYVIRYQPAGGGTVVLAGDSHDDTWEHILDKHKSVVTDIDILVAPHHGRDSGRSFDFLDVLKPKLTFFGNAPSEDLAYDAWRRRGLPIITNNQAGCIIADAGDAKFEIYVTNETFARASNPATAYSEEFDAYHLCTVECD